MAMIYILYGLIALCQPTADRRETLSSDNKIRFGYKLTELVLNSDWLKYFKAIAWLSTWLSNHKVVQ